MRERRNVAVSQYLEHRILFMLIEHSRALSEQVVAVCHLDDGDEGTPEVGKKLVIDVKISLLWICQTFAVLLLRMASG